MTIEDLKQWRKDNGYTQKELSKALSVQPLCVARWEIGTRKIPSFLHLALRCLELEGGERESQGTRKRKGGNENGQRL